MIRTTNTSPHHAPSATTLPSQQDNAAAPASALANTLATTEAAQSNRPPPPHANASRLRLTTSYANARREFRWEDVMICYAFQPAVTDLLSVARAAPGGIHGRDRDGKTLVEAAVHEPVSATGDCFCNCVRSAPISRSQMRKAIPCCTG